VNIVEAFEFVVEQASNNPKLEADLRSTHRLVLKQLGTPNAESHPSFPTWKRHERRLWLLIQAVDERVQSRRYELVDIDEEIGRLERLVAAMEKTP
jgi:hypothetical protein